ncbi:MAG: AraC family transcriptional regulator ligand-binding domain-containing protein [Gammaproteobacteria bacterium]
MTMKLRRTSARTPPAPGNRSTIRAFFLAPLVRELGKYGFEIDAYLRRYGLSAAQLTSLYHRVPLRHFVAIAEELSLSFNRPFLGLDLGKSFKLADLGPFYAMFILAGDLKAALGGLARYQSAWQTNTLLDVVRGRETSACRYLIQDPAIWPRRQDAEFALASLTTLIRQLSSRRWRPVAVEFEHDVEGRSETLSQFFKAPVFGKRSANSLLIANTDMDEPLRSRIAPGDGDVAPLLERHLLELLGPPTEVAQTHAARASDLIARRLGRASVTIDAIAADMSMSVRSLRRHLTEEGSSFRQILQEHRRTTIETVLHAEGARLADLAAQLSYSDGAVLSRAFKSWTGMSPRQYAKTRRD